MLKKREIKLKMGIGIIAVISAVQTYNNYSLKQDSYAQAEEISLQKTNLKSAEEEINALSEEFKALDDEMGIAEAENVELNEQLTEKENLLKEEVEKNKKLEIDLENTQNQLKKEQEKTRHFNQAQERGNVAKATNEEKVKDETNEKKADDQSGSVEMEATYYVAFCDTGCIGITADGTDVRNSIYKNGKRIIATDPKVIPTGTEVIVKTPNGASFNAIAADTGGDIKGNRIDILVGSESEARKLGRHKVEVTILN
ncbi:3D domain-containing protein [Shouchella clausii]|uniref:3D domain-containing protein n=1 Tax=Shouchella clausii TaxID=79880 RepID=UPI001C73A47C|nr:3D domain-containing protein [Shouchella clausii]MBX0320319.1 hypothetical protein [Shouchella clausii]